MRIQWFLLILTLCFATCAMAQDVPNPNALRIYHKQVQRPQSPTIDYNGGPVFEEAPDVYIIYYGNWTTLDHTVIDTFFTNLGGTTMNQINTTYSDNSNKFIPNAINYTPSTHSYHDNYSHGKTVNDGTIQQIVANAISGNHLPNDTDGIYFVITYSDVNDTDGFCSQFCGYHSPSQSIVGGETIKYAMVGNPARCPTACEASRVIGDGKKSPNNDPGADGTVNIMWHEFSESASDPEVNLNTAWNGSNCGESGDCCAWQFGTLHRASNGSHYNETIGGRNYITQMMLKLLSTQRGFNVPGVCKNTF